MVGSSPPVSIHLGPRVARRVGAGGAGLANLLRWWSWCFGDHVTSSVPCRLGAQHPRRTAAMTYPDAAKWCDECYPAPRWGTLWSIPTVLRNPWCTTTGRDTLSRRARSVILAARAPTPLTLVPPYASHPSTSLRHASVAPAHPRISPFYLLGCCPLPRSLPVVISS